MGHLPHRRLGRMHLVANRVAQMVADQPVNVAVEGGREEHGLVSTAYLAQQPLNLGQKAHVRHAVRFVDDHHLDMVEVDGAALAQVDQAARGGDDQVRALGQRPDLGVHARSAVAGRQLQARLPGQGLEDLGHLTGQLPGGHQRQAPRRARSGRGSGGLGCQALEDRYAEGQRLAGPGLGLAAHVSPGQGIGDGEGLDRKGLSDAVGFKGRDQVGRHPQGGERAG